MGVTRGLGSGRFRAPEGGEDGLARATSPRAAPACRARACRQPAAPVSLGSEAVIIIPAVEGLCTSSPPPS
eukprot:3868144-Pyramimonas_sp.AAC.1